MGRWIGRLTSAGLAVVAALHVAWGMGSSFPFRSRSELADAVIGSPTTPPPAACYGVAGALAVAAGLVMDVPIGSPGLRRIGRTGAAAILALRGLVGLAQRTDLVSPGSSSARFRRLDRRFYSPLCLMLALGVATAPSRR